ncbi:MAG: hypothetical protein GF311_27875 [Candidatus Lokiarchaeota archaeon]|nr:hypothetical protein [Candidatus Lokiarchaeota archaeon]
MLKKILTIAGQLLLLVIGYFLISLLTGTVSGTAKLFDLTKEQQLSVAKGLIYVAFSFSALILYLCKRSKWAGLKLFASIFLLYFGITVLLTQSESFVFLEQLVRIIPKGALPLLIIDNTMTAFLFSLLAVWVSGKWKQKTMVNDEKPIEMNWKIFLSKLAILGMLYYAIYTAFGRYVMIPIAGVEAFQEYYANLIVPSWMPLFQFIRGIVWVLIGMPIIFMFTGSKHETAIAIGLSFSILMGMNLLIPLPYMSERIRIAHFIEIMTSNFT